MGQKFQIRVIGVLTGFVNGLFGSGGGTLVVPAMERFLGARNSNCCDIAPVAHLFGDLSVAYR